MRIGDCLFYLNFVWFGFWCMRKLQGSNLYGFLCLQAGKGDGSYMQLCSIFLCMGQAIIYPSMYSLNLLLYNKDYKTSNIHRWLSCIDALPRVLITLAIMYTLRKGYQETVLSPQAWRLLWKLFSSPLGGRNSLSSLCQGTDSHTRLMPPVFFWALQTFFFMSYVSCIFKSTKLFL